MDKNEILEKSRKENAKSDEGMERTDDKSARWGGIAFCFMYIFLALFNLFFNKEKNGITFYAISILFWTYFGVSAYPKYQFTKKKAYLLVVVSSGICVVAYLANYIMKVLV